MAGLDQAKRVIDSVIEAMAKGQSLDEWKRWAEQPESRDRSLAKVPDRGGHKIKVIKRMAYGFRDDAKFFLEIRAAFPAIR
jgi:hypothetical protein